jgi:hypothetical protein
MKLALGVDEPNRSKNNPRFSWDNHCQGVERIIGRLYIIYVSKASFHRDNSRIVQCLVRGYGLRLNHPLINYILELQKEPLKKSHWKMNVKHFDELKFKIK